MTLFDRATEAAEHVRRLAGASPKIAIVLGSGLGAVAGHLDDAITVPYESIPHFPRSTVEGHSGKLMIGQLGGVSVAVMQGRVHAYEGYTPEEVTFPMRVLGRLGIETAIVTNAAGGIRLDLEQGQLVLISDHINLTGRNPLVGQNDERFGPRFFDMTGAYSAHLRGLTQSTAECTGFEMPEGTYLCVSGPSYETPAEIRAFRTMGADLVGMSTVHEVIVARHMSIRVLGISCVTNMAAGILKQEINHEEVMETGQRIQARLANLLRALLPEIAIQDRSAR
jgi:purine-nucleoside phosphorylase